MAQLVARAVRDCEVVGSNPITLTMRRQCFALWSSELPYGDVFCGFGRASGGNDRRNDCRHTMGRILRGVTIGNGPYLSKWRYAPKQ